MTATEKRAYSRGRRQDSAAANREAIMEAATGLLDRKLKITMEAVAAAARVTRLTVYNQFGSRQGLLEAVFDRNALSGGIKDLALAAGAVDPEDGLDRMVDILCRLWGENPSIGALQDAAAGDAELQQALESRQARRREVIDALVGRMVGDEARRKDAGDLLYAVVSPSVFRNLASGRTYPEAAALMKVVCRSVMASPEFRPR